MATNQANIKAVITAEDRASRVISSISGRVESMSHKIGSTFKVAGIAAIAGIGALGVASVKAFAESEDAIAQTNAVLKSTGGAAGVTAKMIDELSSSLQKVTRYSDEEIRSSDNLLLTFTNIGKDVFPRATRAVLDMSTAMKQDLKTSSIQLGKALQDPIHGMTALSKVGALNRDDFDRLNKKWSSGTIPLIEQQTELLQALEREFQGSAEAAGGTFAGKLDILRNRLDEVKESLGKTIVDALNPLAKKLADFVASDKFQQWVEQLNAWLAENLPKAIDWLRNEGFPALKNAIDVLWPVVKIAWDMFAGLVDFLNDNKWVLVAVAGLFAAIKTAMALKGGLEAFKLVMGGVKIAFAVAAGTISTPIAIAIAIGAALAAIWKVKGAYNELQKLNKEAAEAISSAKRSADDYIVSANKALAKGKLTYEQYQRNVQSVTGRKTTQVVNGVPQFASGVQDFSGGLAYVHKGEVLANLPKGTDVIPKTQIDRMGGGASTVNINVNVGMFAGTEMELRKTADKILNALRDIASSRNTTVSQMLG